MFRIKAWYLFFKSPSVRNRSVCCIEWKKARTGRCCAVFGHFLYCFASFDSRDFKFSAISDEKSPGCVAEFCAMITPKARHANVYHEHHKFLANEVIACPYVLNKIICPNHFRSLIQIITLQLTTCFRHQHPPVHKLYESQLTKFTNRGRKVRFHELYS